MADSQNPRTFDLEGYEIFDWNEGFKASGLDKVAAYVAVKQPRAYGFAFAISGVLAALETAAGASTPIEAIVGKAQETMRTRLLSDELVDREEYTFEYDFGQQKFIEVENPGWWHKLA